MLISEFHRPDPKQPISKSRKTKKSQRIKGREAIYAPGKFQILYGMERGPALESSGETPKKTSFCLTKHHKMKMGTRRPKGVILTQEVLLCLSKVGPSVGSNSRKQNHFLKGGQQNIWYWWEVLNHQQCLFII